MQTEATKTSAKVIDTKLRNRMAHLHERETGLRELALQVSLMMGRS